MDDILAIILKDTYSLTQLKRRVRALKTYLLQTFFGGAPARTIDEDTNWLKTLPQQLYQKFTKDNVYEIFSKLEQTGVKLPTLTMYLTFEPDEATLGQLGTKARTAFASTTLLLDIKLDPRLIAGAALSWKGIYRDYSLKAKLAEKRQELSQEFRRFLR